jgi:hypothetical protein
MLCKCDPCKTIDVPIVVPVIIVDPPVGDQCVIPAAATYTGGTPVVNAVKHNVDVQDDEIVSPKERIKVVRAAVGSSLSDNHLNWILATSGMETTFKWRVTDTLGIFVPSCPRCVVGLEGRDGVAWAAWRDPVCKMLLMNEGLVTTPDPSTKRAMLWSPKILSGMGDNNVVRRLFEMTVMYRLAPLLTHFSIGPTQIYLGQSKLFNDSQPPERRNATVAWSPGTWDDLIKFYIKDDRKVLATQRIAMYLKTPPPPPPSEESAVPWLTSQTGGPLLARQYYNGVGPFANSGGWKSKYATVIATGA